MNSLNNLCTKLIYAMLMFLQALKYPAPSKCYNFLPLNGSHNMQQRNGAIYLVHSERQWNARNKPEK